MQSDRAKKTTATGPKGSEVFDPWSCSLEAMNAFDEASTLELAHPARPLFQWHAAQAINAMRAETDASGFAVLACVRKCANHDLAMPEWLAHAFIRHYDAVLNCRADSWDDDAAFGKPYPKGTNLHALRKKRELRVQVWLHATRLINADSNRAIDKGLFEEIGKRLYIGGTLAETLLRQAERLIGLKVVDIKRQHQGRKIPRKSRILRDYK